MYAVVDAKTFSEAIEKYKNEDAVLLDVNYKPLKGGTLRVISDAEYHSLDAPVSGIKIPLFNGSSGIVRLKKSQLSKIRKMLRKAREKGEAVVRIGRDYWLVQRKRYGRLVPIIEIELDGEKLHFKE